MNRLLLGLILLGLLRLSACMDHEEDQSKITEKDTLSVDLSRIKSIRIVNPVGTIVCRGDTSAGNWHAFLSKGVKTSDKDQARIVFQRIQLEQTEKENELIWEISMSSEDKNIAQCGFELVIPQQMKINFSSEVGDFTLLNTNGAISLKSLTGNILVDGVIADQIAIDLLTGTIFAELASETIPTWNLKLTTGTIDCYIPKSISAVVECQVTSGTIQSRNLDLYNAEESFTMLRWKNMQGEGKITLDLITGTISLTGY